MAEPVCATLLDEALEAWEYTRQGVLAEASELPDDEWGFRPHPRSRSVAELARHVLESGLMMVGELTRGDGDFQRQAFPALMEEYV
ncbi:MAG TPA: DinB family protein, partial [Longimicrobiales bacterium]|nr:DinB family protein [Longimicrobiales bacterium]